MKWHSFEKDQCPSTSFVFTVKEGTQYGTRSSPCRKQEALTALQADSSGPYQQAVRCGFDDFIFTASTCELTCMMLLDKEYNSTIICQFP